MTTTVIFEEWLEALQETTSRTGDVMHNPGVKLLDFSASMKQSAAKVELRTERTVGRSQTMEELKAVGPEWMEIWLAQWDF